MMELGTREILLAVGLLLIVIITLDGLRRMRQSSQGQIRMGRRRGVFDDDVSYDPYAGELPGKVRTRTREELDPTFSGQDESQDDRYAEPTMESRIEPAVAVPQQEALNLGDEPPAPVQVREPPRRQPVTRTEPPSRPDEASLEVMALHVMAPQGTPFQGERLLSELMANDMRYGSMKIFHRHEGSDGIGQVLFSLANSVKPGTFDLNTMGDFSTPGISLFMALDDVDQPSDAFELMLETGHNLADQLGGELKDESRSAMTRQTEDHCRLRIKEFERRRLYRMTDS